MKEIHGLVPEAESTPVYLEGHDIDFLVKQSSFYGGVCFRITKVRAGEENVLEWREGYVEDVQKIINFLL